MEVLEFIRSHAQALPPLAKFALGMALIFGIPPLSRRVRLPGVVGLLLSGVVIGPHVLGIFGEQRPIADFFANVGKLLLMFVAGLEMDLARFRQTQGRSILFGLITATVPLLLGAAVGLGFGYDTITAIVVGSLLASHTLLGSRVVASLAQIDLSLSPSQSARPCYPTRYLWSYSQSAFPLMRAAFRSPALRCNLSRSRSLFRLFCLA